MANTEKKKFQFKMPHTYVILVSIMVLMLVLTHIIPARSTVSRSTKLWR